MERKHFLKNGLKALGLISVLPLANACHKVNSGSGNTTNGGSVISPDGEAGPFPTNTPSSYSRTDITSGNPTSGGVPLTINITINNVNNNCVALANAIVDIWHCSILGYYSEYSDSPGASYTTIDYTAAHFLRGRQITDGNGLVSFTSIYPGWYSGRAPHIHVHIYNSAGTSLKITQIAFPETASNVIYTTAAAYSAHGTQDTSNATDHVFAGNVAAMQATVTGSISAGYVLTKIIEVAA